MARKPGNIDRFQILEEIGSGGMGTVFRALDPRFRPPRVVALKLLREGFDTPDLRERFMQEASSAGRLSNPHIVTIYEVGEYENQPYIVMEFVAGDPLDRLLKRRDESLTLLRKLELGEELCAGLAYAHAHGIIHRDIKPSNLIVSPTVLKILDFGIARVADSELTKVDALMGSPNYMSPEQLASAKVDKRSDIFAVGAVFYELLVFQRAFPGAGAEAIAGILTREPLLLSQIWPDVDPQLEQIVTKALLKDPERRYQDLGAMRRDIVKLRERLQRDLSDTLIRTVATTVINPPVPTPVFSPTPKDQWSTREDVIRRALREVDEARTLFDQGAIPEALRRLEHFTPSNELVNNALANLRERAAEIERETQRRAVIQAGLQSARAYFAQAEYAAAITAAKNVLRVDQDEEEARQIIDRADAVIREQQRKRALDQEALDAVVEARRVFAQGDRRAALARLRDFRPVHSATSSALAELEAADAAMVEKERAAAVRRQVDALIAEGSSLLDRNDVDGALRVALEALDLLPDDPDALALKRATDDARHRRVAARAREANILSELSAAQAAHQAGNSNAVLRHTEAVLAMDPSRLEARELREQALAVLDRRREFHGYLDKAGLHLDQGEYPLAIQAAKAAHRIDEQDPVARDIIARAETAIRQQERQTTLQLAQSAKDLANELPQRDPEKPIVALEPARRVLTALNSTRSRIALLVAGGGVFAFVLLISLREVPNVTSPPAPPPPAQTDTTTMKPPVTKDVTSITDDRIVSLRQEIGARLSAGDIDRAIPLLTEALALQPNAGDLAESLREATRLARRRASELRNSVGQKGPESRAFYQQGVAAFSEGVRLQNSGADLDAANRYTMAATLFSRAGQRAASEQSQTASTGPDQRTNSQPTPPVAKSEPPPLGESPQAQPQAPPPVRTAPTSAGAQPSPPSDSPPGSKQTSDSLIQRDRQEIEQLLVQYERAYESLDADAVARITPMDAATVQRLRGAFRESVSYQLQIDSEPPTFSDDRTRATVVTMVTIIHIVSAGRTPSPIRTKRVFEFQKSGGIWRIIGTK